ncbi:MAG TPA: HEAT repeat domain-containing protein [Nitrospirota bacterium]|nr:HEAT repeat domain-containing protein [Nitrospirota bacterium]
MADLEGLGGKLQSTDAEERREAAVDLGRYGREAVPYLFRVIGDSDWRVRKTVVEALVGLADSDVVAGLVHALAAHDNAGARNSAIEALVEIGAASVGPLLASLPDPDPDVTKFIVDVLGDIRDVRSVPALIERLSDPDENIRVASAEALGKIRDRRAVDPLLACLSRYDQGWLDYAAAEALGEIGDDRALGPLIAALGRSSLREPVLESLGRIGNVDTLAPLLAGIADPLRIVREVSLTALIAIHRKSTEADRGRIVAAVRSGANDRIVNFLEEMLITSTGELQQAAIAALGWAGRESSIRKLLALLREEDMEEPMVRALVTLEADATGFLLEYLRDDNALVRRTVARVLGSKGRAEAEEQLIELLQDENGHVRSTAAEALGHLHSRTAIGQLLELLTDEYESVQESAIIALAEIGEESVLDGLLKDFTSRDPALRRNIVLLMGKFSSDRAIEAMAFALKDEEPAVRKAVVHSLGTLTGERSYRSLMLAVTDDDPEVRMLAADALGGTGRPEAADTLLSLLQDPDLWVRAAAARGLGKIGGDRIGNALAGHLSQAADIFLLAIVEVLGQLRPPAALERLLKLADHTDPEVRKTVIGALAGYPWGLVRQSVIAQLSDQHWSVRKTAIEVLGQKGDAAAAPLLERIADEDPDGTVRETAKDALKNHV